MSKKLAATVCAVLASSTLMAGCAAVNWLFGSGPKLTSFTEISFGDPLTRVRFVYPTGAEVTSPLGATAYRVPNLTSGTVTYDWVTYEFDGQRGMQFVMAIFPPEQADAVFDGLMAGLGQPNMFDSHAVHGEVEWRTSNGVTVHYRPVEDRLYLIAPGGFGLRHEIALRSESGTEF